MITIPFLNCVEKCNQDFLCYILPKLYKDLSKGIMDTLDEYKVPWTHVNMEQNSPESELDTFLLKQMCIKSAEGVRMQCSREYWDEDENTKLRASQLRKMSSDVKSYLPKNNIVSERLLTKFG